MKKRIIDLVVTMFGLIAARGVALLSSIIIARVAGAETFGEFSLFITIFIVVSEVPNSIDTTFIRFANSPNESGSMQSFQLVAIGFKLCYVLIAGLSAPFLSLYVAESIFNKPETSELIYWSVITGSLLCVHMLIVGSLQQQNKFKYISLVRPIYGALILLGLVVFIARGEQVNMAVIYDLYLYVILPLALASLLILLPRVISYYPEALAHIKKFTPVCFILVFSSLIILVSNRLDIFFMTSLLDFESIGLYGAAIRISVVVALITAAMSTIYLPKASEATQDVHAFKVYIRLMITYSAIQTLFAILIIWQIDRVVYLFFGEKYSGIETISIILTFQVLFEAYSRGFQALIQCGPNPKIFMAISLVRLLISGMLLLVLVPLYGTVGSALSVALTSAIIGIWIGYYALRDCQPRNIIL